MNKETIEEAVKSYYKNNIDESNIPREHYESEIQDLMIGFANQQIERMYSEEEVIELLNKREDYIDQTSSIFDYISTKQWFNQVKK
jgi:hypothetical protein